ncbi:Proline iminopeptidase [Penicillium hispanicum]|uniref:Proline iminopeptidase n=1 Tax=Penicillium hispanicum TaxID=1080232 RepID=UPI0025400A5E|nr:Proline iminopeptidase [Penicillium hispanicum]KAJ5570068.1 Proline iminopeptidase [Penicillium hispanicum]
MSGYTHSDPFDEGLLAVGAIHRLHYQQYGKKDGKPVIFLHGGPGGHTSKGNTAYFNPAIYRVVLLDQRGTGKSQPTTELRENTTPALVSDIEALRLHLQIPKWHLIFGGSWGTTLALLYAQAYPTAVGSLILRGIFTTRRAEVDWSRGPVGAANVFPEAWEKFLDYLPEEERGEPVGGYYKRLTSDDHATRVDAAKEWNRWDMSIGSLRTDEAGFAMLEDEEWSVPHALMEAHYAVHNFWLEEGQILKPENLAKVQHIRVTIVHGRYDMEPGTRANLLTACDEYGALDLV